MAISAGPQQMPPGHTTAYVVSRTEHALASSAAASIQYVRASWSDNTSVDIQPLPSDDFVFPGLRYATNWYYGGTWQTGVYGADGKLAEGLGMIDLTSRTISLALVDYQAKTWQQFTPAAAQAGASAQGCERAWPGLGGFTPSASASWAEQVRHLLGCGLYAVAGRQIVDGVDAIELLPTGADRMPGVLRATIWINLSTYLPVRILI